MVSLKESLDLKKKSMPVFFTTTFLSKLVQMSVKLFGVFLDIINLLSLSTDLVFKAYHIDFVHIWSLLMKQNYDFFAQCVFCIVLPDIAFFI